MPLATRATLAPSGEIADSTFTASSAGGLAASPPSVSSHQTRKLLGAHILAPKSSDSIQTAALALKAGMTYDDLAETVFPYLTTVEGLKLAARTFDRDVKKLSCYAE